MADAGVYSRNLFDLLDDENQDASAQAAVAKPAKDAKKDAKAAPAAAAPAKKDDTRARPEQNKIRTGYPGRGGANGPRGGKAAGGESNGPVTKDRNVPPRLARQGGEGGEGAVDVTEAREDRAARRERSDRAPRGEFRGRGRGAGGRGGAGGRLPRHEFDRHGNIEHADSGKKESAGKGSWGAPGAEAAEAGENAEVAVDGEVKEPAEPTQEELDRKAAAEERRRQEEEDAKLMTLEQYQSAQAAKRAGSAAAPARKANEGVDESQWKTKKLERSGEDEVYFAGKGVAKPTKEKVKKVKETIELNLKFSDDARAPPSTRGRGGESRGGRGAGRGRGAPAVSRGAANGGANVALADTSAFPSLTKA